ncbi:hypothetical protein MLOOGBEN_10370 [Bacillus sp. EB106-08-02-XG196]|uniref:hypothetical protein n=1 Tax=Bacillus sp. EB106-08-02-XG196 TaxID=2737049 RepID=UPI0015C4AE05|nr:hypothetical protein [Bacillus sp. EB106-08-02-XG196]NWQ41099.1 hypothetical protein [Bacillus sp. EB106-08-02-XG196]
MSNPFFDKINFHDNHYLYKLQKNNSNLIGTWGVETADSKSFLSLENGGYDYEVEKVSSSINSISNQFISNYTFNEGKFNLNLNESIDNNKVYREHRLQALEDSYFMDFVMRFQFNKDLFPYASIGGDVFEHKNIYINYQYEVDKVVLYGETYKVTVEVTDVKKVDNFKQVIYVRGNENYWVVHVRLFPRAYDREIIKLVRYTKKARPLPQFLANALLKTPLNKHLWYNGEKSTLKLPINAFGLVKVCKSEELVLKTRTIFEHI